MVLGLGSIGKFRYIYDDNFNSFTRGCVTGKQIENLRKYLEDPNQPGIYRWDFMDGYDEDGKSGLASKPDLQEKVRRVVTQGHIDPEDWNGVSSSAVTFKYRAKLYRTPR